jgi:WD40 repeat protein
VAFSPDGKTAVSVGFRPGPTMRLWDVETGRQLHPFEGRTPAAWDVTFTPDGSGVVSAGNDGTVRMWEARTGRLLRAYRAHSGPVRGVAVSPDGRSLLSAGEDRTIVLLPLVR